MRKNLPLIFLGLCLVYWGVLTVVNVMGASATMQARGGKVLAKGGKVVATIPAPPVPPEPVSWTDTNSYVAYYDGEILTNGLWEDTSGNNADQTDHSVTQIVESTNTSGRTEHGMSFNGSSSYTERTTPWYGYSTSAWAVGGWFWWNGGTDKAKRMLWDNGVPGVNGHCLYVDNTRTQMLVSSISGTGKFVYWNVAMPSSQWVHIVLTRTNGTADAYNLFTNGTLAATGSVGVAANNPASTARIGRGFSSGYLDVFWDGTIDEFFFANRGFETIDCQLHMSNTPPVRNLSGCYSGGNIRVRGTP